MQNNILHKFIYLCNNTSVNRSIFYGFCTSEDLN